MQPQLFGLGLTVLYSRQGELIMMAPALRVKPAEYIGGRSLAQPAGGNNLYKLLYSLEQGV